jgi:hypothetical protein
MTALVASVGLGFILKTVAMAAGVFAATFGLLMLWGLCRVAGKPMPRPDQDPGDRGPAVVNVRKV